MKLNRFNILFLILFALVASRLTMHREGTKPVTQYINDHCPHDTIKPSGDSTSTIWQFSKNRHLSMEERRQVFIRKLSKI